MDGGKEERGRLEKRGRKDLIQGHSRGNYDQEQSPAGSRKSYEQKTGLTFLPPIRGTAFDLQEDKVGEFVNWLGKTSARGFVVAKRKIGIKEKDPLAEEKPALPEPFLSYSRKLQQLCENAWFGRTVLFVIVMNTVSMAANSYGMGDAYYEVLDGCELTFTIVFIVEFVIKHLAYQKLRI